MKSNAPSRIVWILSLILGALAVISKYVDIPYVSPYKFWVLLAGLVLLLLGTLLKGF